MLGDGISQKNERSEEVRQESDRSYLLDQQLIPARVASFSDAKREIQMTNSQEDILEPQILLVQVTSLEESLSAIHHSSYANDYSLRRLCAGASHPC